MNSYFCENFKFFAVIVVLIQIIFGVIPFIYRQIIKPALIGDKINFKKYGKWALVTGATDGIGKEYARQLAQKGLNIILVSRTHSKLQSVAQQIQNEFKVETLIISVDFTSPGTQIYETIKNEIKGKEIGILVNNVGMANPEWDVFLKIPNLEKHIQDLIQCNVMSVPMMCNLVLPQMVERKIGLVINLSSISAVIPTPYVTVYAATKAFVHKFSQDLEMEYKSQGIVVQTLVPGPVANPLIKLEKSSINVPIPEVYVKSALKTVESTTCTYGFLIHMITTTLVIWIYFASPSFAKFIIMQRKIKERKRVIEYEKSKNI